MFWQCDGKADCPKGSDEMDCPCEEGILCTQFNKTICIPKGWKCKAQITCGNFDTSLSCENERPDFTSIACEIGHSLCPVIQQCQLMFPEDKQKCFGKFIQQ